MNLYSRHLERLPILQEYLNYRTTGYIRLLSGKTAAVKKIFT